MDSGEMLVTVSEEFGLHTIDLLTTYAPGDNFRIACGNHKGKTCLNLVVDGEIVRSATGQADLRMRVA